MPKYIKQEMPDLHQTGEKKIYYRLKTDRHFDFNHFIQSLHQSNNGISEADAIRILLSAADHLATLLGKGNSVTLNGIGTFKATIGLEEDKELIKKARKDCKLQREGIARIRRSPYSKEERLALALDYLDKHGAMRIADYMELTGLARTAATLELQEFRQDMTSGIDFIGRGSAKVYVKRI